MQLRSLVLPAQALARLHVHGRAATVLTMSCAVAGLGTPDLGRMLASFGSL